LKLVLKTPIFHQFTCQVVIERFVFGQFVTGQFNKTITFNVNVNVICLPTEHQGAQRTRLNVAVHSQIELEFGNVGF